jgi:hypothetical protein
MYYYIVHTVLVRRIKKMSKEVSKESSLEKSANLIITV